MKSKGQENSRLPRGFVPEPFAYHEEVELEIEQLTNLGLGLGRIEGWVVMVPFALPGERVLARIFRNKKNYSEGDLLKILKASPDRVEPRCPLFTECGGCQYQHLDYERQLEWKREQVVEIFRRIGGVEAPPVAPTHPSPRTYHYRSKLTPHWDRPKRGEAPEEIGFLRFGRRSTIDVEQCLIATERINAALPEAREEVRQASRGRSRARGGTLFLREVEEGVVRETDRVVTERVGDRVFQFRAGDFFQNNPFILPSLVETVGCWAKTDTIDHLVDAYCGTGLFSICLGDRFREVVGIEISSSSIRWAINNAAINRLEHCRFQIGSAEAIFEEVPFAGVSATVIIDPPRKGCDPAFLQQLVRYRPRRVVYVSCDPSTQARDIAVCLEAGYGLLAVEPFDLFPQTRHIESVAVLEDQSLPGSTSPGS